ncbi:unnamed protein product [Wuchereria bancrofti]|uniref:Uncharacterized protein n=2 Tax=Wuchereria bancrofti TaxID=6293 RepID=A0A3P7E4B2_WUCBA|nr:unnamed protein product [Wuchereria bancrofti]
MNRERNVQWLCPIDEVPFLEQSTGQPRYCSFTIHCPTGYRCFQDTVCCRKPGQCLNGQSIATDSNGKFMIT